jgi:fatty acid desaturase
MATQQQGQQLESSQKREHNRRRPPWKRWLIASIIFVLIAIGTVIWIVTDQGSLTAILPIVIFTVLGVLIGLFQWLFPVSSGSTEHTGINIHPSLIAQLSSITSSPA